MTQNAEPNTLVVDGETFRVSRREDAAGWAFDWLSGPNEGYGFTQSEPIVAHREGDAPPPKPVMDENRMRESIRSFLADVDPSTGYIE